MVTRILLGLVVLYLLVLLAGFVVQRSLLYPRDPTRVSPAAAGLPGVRELEIAAPDGARIVAWYGAAKADPTTGTRSAGPATVKAAPTLLYFHGNGGSLAARTPRIERFMAEGWGVFMMTYRGYGGSTGMPTETDNIGDALRAFDTLVALGVAPADIVLYGESLGTGIATRVALERPAAGLILDAPYTSIPDVAAIGFWFIPVHLLMRDRYETSRIIDKVRTPLLILHGARDATIPIRMGRALYALANQPKTFVELPRGGHSDLYINGNDALSHVRTFLQGLRR